MLNTADVGVRSGLALKLIPRAAMNHGPAVQDLERPPLRLRDCYWFFGPLVLMVELNMMSKSVIHAFLARTDNPSTALAAFNAAFTFYFAITAADYDSTERGLHAGRQHTV
jgi:hypothetical protein